MAVNVMRTHNAVQRNIRDAPGWCIAVEMTRVSHVTRGAAYRLTCNLRFRCPHLVENTVHNHIMRAGLPIFVHEEKRGWEWVYQNQVNPIMDDDPYRL